MASVRNMPRRARWILAILGLAAWIGMVYWATTNGGPSR